MKALNLPAFDHQIKYKDDQPLIFDVIRKKYIVLQPEEWVRQHMVNFLIHHRSYPRSLVTVESGLKYANTVAKRTDIVIYNSQGNAEMLVECKAYDVKLSQKTFDQIAVYNTKVKARYLVITNGLEHFCCFFDEEQEGYKFLNDIPDYTNGK